MKFQLDRYVNGNLCIQCFQDDAPTVPFGKLSTNLDRLLPDNCFFAKDWSENLHWATELLSLPDFEKTDMITYSGYVKVTVYRLTPEFIHNLYEESYNSKTDIYECTDTLFDLHKKYCE